MVGSALVRALANNGDINLVLKSSSELDLLDQNAVRRFFSNFKIDEMYIAAAKVGGILANSSFPAQFIYENLMIESNLIHTAYESGCKKIMFLGSSCVYPKLAEQPIKEEALLSGYLEETNEAYALAKIAGIKLCHSYSEQYKCDYRSVMPTNLYGPFDNFHKEGSHVIPGLIRRLDEAKANNIEVFYAWGTGSPLREFMHVDDMADATIFLMNLNEEKYNKFMNNYINHINIGTGIECSISKLVYKISEIVGYRGQIEFDQTKPDGTPRKLLDTKILDSLGWKSKINLDEGLADTYDWFLENRSKLRG